jgi:Subtilase family
VRPIFAEAIPDGEIIPGATAEELADAIVQVIDAGARIVNLSLALQGPSSKGERSLELALNHAARRGVVVVAAAGNQGTVGGSAITRHPWVTPVIACDHRGRPMDISNLSASIGRCGLGAPGDAITSLGPTAEPLTMGGTSAATPFVTGAVALMWSAFPRASAAAVRSAVTQAGGRQRTAIVPPLLKPGRVTKRCRELAADGEVCSIMNANPTAKDETKTTPHKVRLPGFISDEDVGLGEVVKRVTYAMGIKPCGGCERRAAAMNRWMVFTR